MDTKNENRATRLRRNAASKASASAPVGRPRKLTAEGILEAAIEIIDTEGTDKLSMRSLAKHLEVQANAIYTHYDNLQAVEEAVVDRLLNKIPTPDASRGPPLRDQLIDHFAALRAALVLHPRVTTFDVGSPAWISNARHIDRTLEQLVAQGIDIAVAHVAYTALSGVTLMSAAQANAYRHADVTSDQRKALAALKHIQANHVMQMMSLPSMHLPVEQRFRQLVGNLIDLLLPASVAKPPKKTTGKAAK